LIIFMLWAFPTLICAQNMVDDQGLKQGEWSKKWKSGATRYKGQFLNDKPVGEFHYWYSTGEAQSVLTYAVGGHIAHCITYGLDGNVAAKGKYVDQLKDSIWLFFDYQGRLRSKNDYNEGLLEGEQVTYNYAGKIMEIIAYYDDKKHGDWTQFYKNGKIKVKGQWNEGYPSGKLYRYSESGRQVLQGQYKNGVEHGWWRTYNSSGKEEQKIFYLEGKILKGKALETYQDKMRMLKENEQE